MPTLRYCSVFTLSAALMMTPGVLYEAVAGTKNIKEPTMIMNAGNRAGLQYLYAWDQNCRPVPVKFTPLKASKGRLFTVNGTFRIVSSQSAKCAGRSVPGKKVVFKANRNASGETIIQYRISSKNTFDDYIISRPITVRN